MCITKKWAHSSRESTPMMGCRIVRFSTMSENARILLLVLRNSLVIVFSVASMEGIATAGAAMAPRGIDSCLNR